MSQPQRVSFIPALRSPLEQGNNEVRQRALTLCAKDLSILIGNISYLPKTFSPFRLPAVIPGAQYNYALLVSNYVIVALFTILEIVLTTAYIPILLWSYSYVFLTYSASVVTLIVGISRVTWGTHIVQSTVALGTRPTEDERWLFVNGIGTSHYMLQNTINALASTFGRPITAIHNRSYGILVDILECVIMRDFGYKNITVRLTYEHLKQHLGNDNVQKLVIIAHSQGGMIVALAVDHLFAHLPAHAFSKLCWVFREGANMKLEEIYTFGSAANHFHNPSRSTQPSTPTVQAMEDSTICCAHPRVSSGSRYIPVIEHYVNSYDLVPRWGVLYHVRRKADDNYAGKVFVHEKATGHLIDQHYLEVMFPRSYAEDDPKAFLNHIVFADQEVFVERASTWTVPDRNSGMDNGLQNLDFNTQTIDEQWDKPQRSEWQEATLLNGQKVKDLSNLWKYLGGSKP